jgi:membrane protease YdiL (CAAX protease family)
LDIYKDSAENVAEGVYTPVRRRRLYLAMEFASIFIGLPSLSICLRHAIHPIPALWCLAALCAWVLKRDGYFTRHRLWGGSPTGKQILFTIGRFLLMAAAIGLLTVLFEHDRVLVFPKTRPVMWLIVMFLYPLLSAVPQGIVYRAFIFHRYGKLFGKGWAIIAASGLAFCYAHIFFMNTVAIVLTLVGGFMFALTYQRSRSLLFSCVEHALYGDYIFTIGLGYYIYSGAVRDLAARAVQSYGLRVPGF